MEVRLVIHRQGDVYKARWVESDGQEGSPFTLVLPLTAADTSDLRWYLETYLQFAGKGDAARAQSIEHKMEGWGRALVDALFGTPESRDVYHNLLDADGPRLLTLGATDADVLAQPWEMLRDARGPLAFRGVIVRRQLKGSGRTRRFDLGLPLRVLLIVSRPTDAGFLDPRTSTASLLDALDALPGQVEIDFCDPPTLPRLEEMISDARKARQPYHIVHFDGHGTYLPLTGIGALCFEDGEGKTNLVAGPDLGDLLTRLDVPLVVLEACRTASLSERPVFGSVAPALLQSGVGSVVAFSHAVHVRAATLLVERLYRELCAGQTVGQALEEGRVALRADPKRWLHRGPNAATIDLQDWFIPQLYQVGEDVVLVRKRRTAASRQAVGGRRSAADERRLYHFPPPPLYRFHGRALELLELERAFRRYPAVVLTGMGGMGKTALAREAAAWWLRKGRCEAAVFCSFEFRAGAERVVQLLGQALEGEGFSARPAEEQWRTAVDLFHRRQVLLVWDNFESTLPAWQAGAATGEAGAPPAAQVLGFGPDERARLLQLYRDLTGSEGGEPAGRLLVTCRPAETGLPGVKELPLQGLARPDSLYLLAAVLDLKGISTERPGYEREEMDELLEMLADHPLSIELVALHLKGLTPAQIRDDYAVLLERFADERAYEGRNRSLLASLEFSRQRLSAAAQAALPYLAWFEGGAFEQSILNFANLQPEAWQPIRDELAATALVQVEQMEQFNTPYVRFHPTLPYAVRREGVADPEGAEGRFIAVYLGVRNTADEALGRRRPAAGMVLIGREEGNLRGAMVRAFARGARDQGAVIAETLNVYLEMAGRLRERDGLAEWVRQQVDAGGALDKAAWSAILDHAWSLCTQGQADEAVRQVQELIARLEVEGLAGGADPAFQIATSYRYLGRIHVEACRPDLVLEPARKAIEMFERLPGEGARVNLAAALGDLANANMMLGRFDAALQAAERGLAIMREQGREREIVADLGRIAAILVEQQRYAEAEARYDEALQAAHATDDLQLYGLILQHQAILQARLSRHGRAVELLHQAIVLFQRAADVGEEMRTCDLLATAEVGRGQLEAAEAWCARSRELALQLGDRYQQAGVAQNVGILYQIQAERTQNPAARAALLCQAIGSARESLTAWLELGNQVNAAASYSQLGVLYRMTGDLERAEEHLQQGLQIRESLDLPDVYKDYGNLADIAHARGDGEAAARWQAKHDTKLAEVERLRRGGEDQETRGQGEGGVGQVVLALAQAVYRARGAGGRVPLEVGEALAQLEQVPPPLGAIAPFLRAVGSGQPVPPVPPGLPGELASILQALAQAVARLDAGEPDKDERESTISLEELLALVVAGCRGDTEAGQRAYAIVRALQQPGAPPQYALLGKALQRLLEGLRGAAVLEGLPADLAPIVEKVERALKTQSSTGS